MQASPTRPSLSSLPPWGPISATLCLISHSRFPRAALRHIAYPLTHISPSLRRFTSPPPSSGFAAFPGRGFWSARASQLGHLESPIQHIVTSQLHRTSPVNRTPHLLTVHITMLVRALDARVCPSIQINSPHTPAHTPAVTALLASKNFEKTEVGATWGLGIAAPEPLWPRYGSKSAPGELQDSPKGALGCPKTAPRALWEAPRRLHERSGRLQDAPRAFRETSRRPQELEDGPKIVPGAS